MVKTDQSKNKKIVKQSIDSINELRKSIIKKEVPKNEKPNKIIHNVKKILDLNNPEKGTGLKIITPKQILHRLPISKIVH